MNNKTEKTIGEILREKWEENNKNNSKEGKESFWKEEKTLIEIPESESSFSEVKLVLDKSDKILIGIQSRYINKKSGEIAYGKGMYKQLSFWQDFLKVNLAELIKNSENNSIKPENTTVIKEKAKKIEKEVKESVKTCCVNCKKPAEKLSKKGLCRECYYIERGKK